MKKIHFIFKYFAIVIFAISIINLQSCKENNCNDDDINNCDTCVIAYKPNIYLYPTENTHLNVSLSFPMGGQIITSIPAYNDSWSVNIEPNGRIDNMYDYLFYESKQPYVWQTKKAWCVKKEDLENFFIENLTDYGFKDGEITDFTEYWIPRLNYSDFYKIYPQESPIINTVIQLEISSIPDNILRLFYVII